MVARATGAYEFAGTSAALATPGLPVEPDPTDSTFDGPSILSRGNSLSPGTKGALTAFGLYAQIIGVYDSGLIAPDTVIGKQSTVGSVTHSQLR